MPLSQNAAFWIAKTAIVHGARGKALFIGRLWPQTLTVAELRDIFFQNEGFGAFPKVNWNDDYYISDVELCGVLGFSSCDSVDLNQDEGATFCFDMNIVPPPISMGTFDTIFNFGTMEHIFHIPNFLQNLYALLKPEGIIFHSAPANNMVEHGFYQFSPTFFFDYYTDNGYKILECVFSKPVADTLGNRRLLTPFNTYEHKADPLYGKMGDSVYDVVFIARKSEFSNWDAIPTQFRYRK